MQKAYRQPLDIRAVVQRGTKMCVTKRVAARCTRLIAASVQARVWIDRLHRDAALSTSCVRACHLW